MTPAQLDEVLPCLQVRLASTPTPPPTYGRHTISTCPSSSPANLTPPLDLTLLPLPLQVLARSSPDDKYTLVARLNGTLPDSKEAWLKDHPGCSWEKDRDKLLPGTL